VGGAREDTMDHENVQRDIQTQYTRAAFQPSSANADKRTVDLVWTTGARVLRGYFDRFWEELSLDPRHVRLDRLNNGAPLLDTHDTNGVGSILGVVEGARLNKNEGIATVRFPKPEDDPEADKIFRKVKDGIIQNVSVGYRVHKMEKVSDGEDKIPVYRAVDWEPTELSLVPVGADDGAGTRSTSSTNPCVFVTHKERKMEPEIPVTTPPATATPPATVDPVLAATRAASAQNIERARAQAAEAARLQEDARAQERERIVEIRRLVRKTNLGDDLAERFISENASLEAVRSAVIEHISTRTAEGDVGNHVRVMAGDDARDKWIRGASAWLFERCGVSHIVRDAKTKAPSLFDGVDVSGGGEFRSFSLLDLARESLERQNVRTRGMSRMEMVGLAFTRLGNYQTTSDFAVLLENVVYKTLLGAYAIQTDTWTMFCKADTVSDFRPANRYRSGSLTVLDSVNEQGEFKQKAIPDGAKMSITTGTKGNILGLSRQTIINDDMGALTDIAEKGGRAAKLTIETDVYALLAQNSGLGPTQSDSQPFFHSNRSNVNATGSALAVLAIEADAVVLNSQKDISSNDYLDLQPHCLLVPRSLKGTANEINKSQYDFDNAGTNTTGKFMRPNRCQGLFQNVIGTPRLSGTRRYIFADPTIAPAIVVAFLEGQGQGPVLDSQNGWRIDGVEWKIRLDAKAQMFDPRGAVTNAGV
jgi:HK97 family phage prohead protease